jgi:tetratricopeptide (TPR) repeat protein
MRLKKIIQNLGEKKTLNGANKAFQSSDFQYAEKLYLKILEKDPENFEGQSWLGSLYSKSGKYQRAAELLENASKQKPTNFQSYLNLGIRT